MDISLVTTKNDIKLFSDYDDGIVQKCRSLNGKWDKEAKAWILSLVDKDIIQKYLLTRFGVDGEHTPKLFTVTIGLPKRLEAYSEGFDCGGWPIASATGRDSGATCAKNIYKKAGQISSGGSRANWKTTMTSDSVFECRHVPEYKKDKMKLDGEWEILSVVEEVGFDRNALMEEQKRIESRLTEITVLLASAPPEPVKPTVKRAYVDQQGEYDHEANGCLEPWR